MNITLVLTVSGTSTTECHQRHGHVSCASSPVLSTENSLHKYEGHPKSFRPQHIRQ